MSKVAKEDACEAPIELSLNLLTALHARRVILLNSLDDKGFARGYIHRRGRISIDDGIQLYAWHSLHHSDRNRLEQMLDEHFRGDVYMKMVYRPKC